MDIYNETVELVEEFQNSISSIVALAAKYKKEYEDWYLNNKHDPELLKKYMKNKIVEALNEDIEH